MSEELVWREDFGLWWPPGENDSVFKRMLARVTDVDTAIKRTRTTGVAVQAGGFVGMWPIRLAKWFERVYTFEPIPHLYECVKRNTNHLPNVRVFNNVLGPTLAEVDIRFKRGGCSRIGEEGTHKVQQLTIDSLCLPRCDALILDVERYELKVLEGARQTIERFRPVIQLETNEDTFREYVEFVTKQFNYAVDRKDHADQLFVPA